MDRDKKEVDEKEVDEKEIEEKEVGGKEVSEAEIKDTAKTWLLVIPLIIAIIGSAVFTGTWLVFRANFPNTSDVHHRVSSLDKELLNSIRSNFRNTYLQFLEVRVHPESERGQGEQLDQLGQRLHELVLEEREIIHKYDPTVNPSGPSAMELFTVILVEMPYTMVFTGSLVVGILLFVIARYIALSVIRRRFSSSYVKEV